MEEWIDWWEGDWMNGIDEWMECWEHGWIDGWVDALIDRKMNGMMGKKEGWMYIDEKMDGLITLLIPEEYYSITQYGRKSIMLYVRKNQT